MFETSTDILNWAISLSVLAVAFFICYGLYLLITTLRKGMKIIKLAENIVHKAENLLDLIKNKISSSASYLYMVTELIKKVSKIVKNKKTEALTIALNPIIVNKKVNGTVILVRKSA